MPRPGRFVDAAAAMRHPMRPMRAAYAALAVAPLVWLPVERVTRAATSRAPRRVEPVVAVTPECPTERLDGVCLPAPRCPVDALDLDGACLPTAGGVEDPGARVELGAHTERDGRRAVYEHIPLKREQPADYARYRYPVQPQSEAHPVTSGYDLGRPDALQRRGASIRAVGHGGVDLPQARGAPVRAVSLRGEVGEPVVVYAGWLFGNSVVLRHVVREGGALRSYLAIHGHLDSVAPGLTRGMFVRPGALLGAVGDSAAEGVVHLHYEVRRVRAGVDPMRAEPGHLDEQDVGVPCDPRNVLPMR